MIVCALSLATVLITEAPVGATTPDRQLYRGAASAIEQRQLSRACELLQRIVTDYPQSDLAEQAAYHLAECLLLDGYPDRALDILAHWSSRIERPSSVQQIFAHPSVEPSFGVGQQKRLPLATQATTLLVRALRELDESPATQATVQKLLETAEANESVSFTTTVLCELARRSQKVGDFAAAKTFLLRAKLACQSNDGERVTELRTRLYFDLPLAWAEQELSTGHAMTAVDILTHATDTLDQSATSKEESPFEFSTEQELARRFLLAEAFFAAGQTVQATEQFDWLTAQAAGVSPQPEWLAAIALRRGELLVRARETEEAQRWLLQAKSDHADFERSYEFDYLLARCAVAKIDFDEACKLLQQVIDARAAHGTETVPRAAWMLGEVYFLQRRYASAIEAYETVAEMKSFPDWQSRALLQSAKCHELLGHTSEALSAYQQALQLSNQPEIQQQATERLSALESLLPTLR